MNCARKARTWADQFGCGALPTDLGVVATDTGGGPVGASWLRYFTEANPAYGFISPAVPELAIGVAADWRGRGVGRLLLRGLADRSRAAGITRLCLSVDRENPARHLYRGEGYQVFRSGETSDTMVLDLWLADRVRFPIPTDRTGGATRHGRKTEQKAGQESGRAAGAG